MKWSLVPYDIPDGNLVPGQSARLRRKSDGLTVSATTADGSGVITFTVDGNPGPCYVDIFRNGFQYLGSSDAAGVAGVLSLEEIQSLLQGMGDVVLRGALSGDLAVAAGWTISAWGVGVAPGAMLIRGVPFVNYTADLFRPTGAVLGRKDRVVVRLTRTGSFAGKTEVAYLTGEDSASPVVPALTQTADTWEVALATITWPAADGTPVATDERAFLYDAYRSRPTVLSTSASAAEVTTASGSGASILGSTLTLPNGVDHLVIVDVLGQVTPASTAYPWEYSYGSLGSALGQFNNPNDVAVSPDGTKLYVADFGNHRVQWYTINVDGTLTLGDSVSG